MLIKDKNSKFYAADHINIKLINRGKKLIYDKDKVFVKLCKGSENIEELFFDENNEPNVHLTTSFIQKKRYWSFNFVQFEGSPWTITCRYCWTKIFGKI